MIKIKSHTFTESEKEEMRNIFNEIDTNKNGFFEKDEMKSLMEKLELGDEFLDLCFFIVDENEDGYITFDEFQKFIGYVEELNKDPLILFKVVFNKLDRDHNGTISFNEMKLFAKLFNSDYSDEGISLIFKKFNKNKIQPITFDELVDALL